MKKGLLTLFLLPAIVLASCTSGESTSGNSSTSGSETSSTNSPSSSLPSSNPPSTSSSSSVEEQGLTDAKLAELAQGYAADLTGLQEITQGASHGYVSFYTQIANGPEDFQLVIYPETSGSDPDRENIDGVFYYHATEIDGIGADEGKKIKALDNISIGLDNKIHHSYFVDMGQEEFTYATFEEDNGLGNFFRFLSADDFTENDEGNYELKEDVLEEYASFISPQAYGGFPELLADSFTLIFENNAIIGYQVTFPAYASALGIVDSTLVLGSFTKVGSDAIEKVAPVEGTADKAFDDMMARLQGNNYRGEGSWNFLVNSTYPEDMNYRAADVVTDGKYFSLTTMEDNDPNAIKEERLIEYDETSETYQTLTRIGDAYYPVGEAKDESAVTYASFALSSVFFTKDAEGVYHLNDAASYPRYVQYGSSDFLVDGFNGTFEAITNLEAVEDFTVEIGEDEAEFYIHNFELLGTGADQRENFQTFTYTEIGDITSETIIGDADIRENCDNLSFADMLSSDPGYPVLLSFIGGEENLKSLPAPGGLFPVWKISYIYDENQMTLECWDFSTSKELQDLDSHYQEKLSAQDSGFTKWTDAQMTQYKDYYDAVYQAEEKITVNGAEKTLLIGLQKNDLQWYKNYMVTLSLS